jgi:hypothetical protein
MIGEAFVISLSWLGVWWMLPPASYYEFIDNIIEQDKSSAKPSPAPAVLQPSTAKAVKNSAPHKVRVMLTYLYMISATYSCLTS